MHFDQFLKLKLGQDIEPDVWSSLLSNIFFCPPFSLLINFLITVTLSDPLCTHIISLSFSLFMSFLWTEVFLESAKKSFEYFCYETGPYQISHMWTFLIYAFWDKCYDLISICLLLQYRGRKKFWNIHCEYFRHRALIKHKCYRVGTSHTLLIEIPTVHRKTDTVYANTP